MKDKAVQEKLSVVQTANQPTAVATVQQPETRLVLSSRAEIHDFSWKAANFTTVALATSAAVVAVQSPIKTMLLNLTKSGSALPTGYAGGTFGLARVLYAGTSASLSGSAVRTAYVTGAKGSSKPIEAELVSQQDQSLIIEDSSVKTERQNGSQKAPAKLGAVAALAIGDIAVTQIPESLSQLKKVNGLLPSNFQWKTPHNMYKLMSGGFVPRYASGIISFASLCILEDKVANKLPLENKKMAHFTAGAVSGMTAAFFSYPFAAFKDHLLVQTTVVNGRLHNKSAFTAMKELSTVFKSNPQAAVKNFGSMAVKQVPMRMALTGAVFALVAGVGEALGNEPLKKVVPEEYQPPKPKSSSAARSPHSLFAHPKAETAGKEETQLVVYNSNNNTPKP